MNHQIKLRPNIAPVADVVPPDVLTPVGNMVAIHQHPVEENDKGIILPDGSENPLQSNICTVISVGPDCKQVKRGDKVLMMPVMCSVLYHRKHAYVFVKEEQIACVLDPNSL